MYVRMFEHCGGVVEVAGADGNSEDPSALGHLIHAGDSRGGASGAHRVSGDLAPVDGAFVTADAAVSLRLDDSEGRVLRALEYSVAVADGISGGTTPCHLERASEGTSSARSCSRRCP